MYINVQNCMFIKTNFLKASRLKYKDVHDICISSDISTDDISVFTYRYSHIAEIWLDIRFYIVAPVPNQECERFLYLCIRGINFTSSYGCSIRFWKCSTMLYLLVFIVLLVSCLTFSGKYFMHV
jgi:hypothetical protein